MYLDRQDRGHNEWVSGAAELTRICQQNFTLTRALVDWKNKA